MTKDCGRDDDDESVETVAVNALLVSLGFDLNKLQQQHMQIIFVHVFRLGQSFTLGQQMRFMQNTMTTTMTTITADADKNNGKESVKKQAKAESHDADLDDALSVNDVVVVVLLDEGAHKQDAAPVRGEAELQM
jgi:hypothetical protein